MKSLRDEFHNSVWGAHFTRSRGNNFSFGEFSERHITIIIICSSSSSSSSSIKSRVKA